MMPIVAIGQKFANVKAAMIIDEELSLDNHMLTPSMKVAPNKVVSTYKAHLASLYDADISVGKDVFIIQLDVLANLNILDNVQD